MSERLLDYDPFTGIKTFFKSEGKHHDQWTFRYEFAPVTPELEASKELQKSDDHWKDGLKNDLVHYAHIPDSILLKWHTEGIDVRDNQALFKKVNSPEWSYLKCTTKLHVARG